MSALENSGGLDRYALIGDLAVRVRRFFDRGWYLMIGLLCLEVGVLSYSGSPGTSAFVLLSLGTVIVLAVWRQNGIGLPITPMLAIQNLFVYGMPIVTHHEVLDKYPPSFLFDSGLELLVFSCCYAGAWRIGMQLFHPSPPICYALPDFQSGGGGKLKRLGFSLAVGGIVYQVLDKLDLLNIIYNLLPSGSSSLLFPLVAGANACGFFLLALFVGSGEFNIRDKAAFWTLFTVSSLINASAFLLSSVTMLVVAVFVGLFWSTGRVPWRYLSIVVLALAFLNIGKFTMRGRYWGFNDEPIPISFVQMPAIYAEWAGASLEALASPVDDRGAQAFKPGAGGPEKSGQSLLDRVNNLQNLLFVIDAMEVEHIPPLGGATYSLIAPLLVPRIMWPDKPRSHEGQVLLNVHFRRQLLASTITTYIAWGLIPEAYGNFGPLVGSLILGAGLGLAFAWVEAFTARKLLLSLEGFVSFVVLIGLANSFEMVASVVVTTVFQSVVPIVFVSLPFLRRMQVTRPETPS